MQVLFRRPVGLTEVDFESAKAVRTQHGSPVPRSRERWKPSWTKVYAGILERDSALQGS